jgi:hypothetical protein
MKEPSTPQVYYDGSLKELAAAHAGLVMASMFLALVPVSVFFLIVGVVYLMDSTEFVRIFLAVFACSIFVSLVLICYHCYRVAKLLMPHLAFVLGAAAFFPPVSLLVLIFLWVSSIRQLRARGLHVGVFGINPVRVEG